MITATVTLRAAASTVWAALTDPKQMKQWYFDIPDFTLLTDATFNFYEPGDGRQFHHRCTIREIIPEKKLSHTWTHPSHSKGESEVTWLLKEENGATHITLQHEGIENLADGGPAFAHENFQVGWEEIISSLKNHIYGITKR
ncbi:MAG: SRPBCC family protein [Bacteroidota bacterium]